jgi:hypothetical protein
MEELSLQIQRLENELRVKNERIKSLEQLIPSSSTPHASGDDDELQQKIASYLQRKALSKGKTVNKTELYINIINTLSCLYHLQYNSEVVDTDDIILQAEKHTKNKSLAVKIAFSYVLEFFRQLEMKKATEVFQKDDDIPLSQESFPMQWLLGMFPCHITSLSPNEKDWLPVHLFLGIDMSTSQIPLDHYLDDLNILLEEFGSDAYDQDISPLSIAVAKKQPTPEVIQTLLQYAPDSILQEDMDGCLPIMHAAATNDTLDVINLLYEADPTSLTRVDNFGGACIHYATFSGRIEMVQYILSKQPSCVQLVEGNGALPLHDAVQNSRGYDVQYEIVQLLITKYPDAIYHRDNQGAFPFHKAVKYSNMRVVELLFERFSKVKRIHFQHNSAFLTFMMKTYRSYLPKILNIYYPCIIIPNEKIKMNI